MHFTCPHCKSALNVQDSAVSPETGLTRVTSQRVPDITPELEENIVAYIRAHCPETRDT